MSQERQDLMYKCYRTLDTKRKSYKGKPTYTITFDLVSDHDDEWSNSSSHLSEDSYISYKEEGGGSTQ